MFAIDESICHISCYGTQIGFGKVVLKQIVTLLTLHMT